jgi:hypothetical protein
MIHFNFQPSNIHLQSHTCAYLEGRYIAKTSKYQPIHPICCKETWEQKYPSETSILHPFPTKREIIPRKKKQLNSPVPQTAYRKQKTSQYLHRAPTLDTSPNSRASSSLNGLESISNNISAKPTSPRAGDLDDEDEDGDGDGGDSDDRGT